jgi:hypothetical protein
MDGTVQTMLSRTITVPAAGYCLVIGTLEAQVQHTNGATTSGTFGVSDQAGVFPATQDVRVSVPPTAATGVYIVPATFQGVFTVTAGAHPFYFLGQENTGTVTFANVQLSIVYIPTAYGTVTPSLTAGNAEPSSDGAAVGSE